MLFCMLLYREIVEMKGIDRNNGNLKEDRKPLIGRETEHYQWFIKNKIFAFT